MEEVATDSAPGKGRHSLGSASVQNSCFLAESSPCASMGGVGVACFIACNLHTHAIKK